MIRGYDEIYLDDAMKNLGEAFDYVANVCGKKLDEFMTLFVAGGISEKFEKGNPRYLTGISGTQLVLEVYERSGIHDIRCDIQISYDYTPEYWGGWILAYYQWWSGHSFRDIHNSIDMKELMKLYPTLHESSEEKCLDSLTIVYNRKHNGSVIQEQRKRCGLSQRELAERSGVNLRTLQQYELETKNIHKAAVDTVMALANTLGCSIETILPPEQGT